MKNSKVETNITRFGQLRVMTGIFRCFRSGHVSLAFTGDLPKRVLELLLTRLLSDIFLPFIHTDEKGALHCRY